MEDETLEDETLEVICFNCNRFFPTSFVDPTDFGICVEDPAFEPFADELIEGPETASCQDLIHIWARQRGGV